MKLTSLVAVVLIAMLTMGCFGMTHVVGDGASGGESMTERQWYVLFGLVPINKVDSKTMAGSAENYTVTTEMTFVDVVIGIFTGLVSIQPMSVTVEK